MSFSSPALTPSMKSGMFSLLSMRHRLVGAAVQRPVQRRHARGHRGVGVDVGGANAAHSAGGAVLLVVGVEDEQHVQCVLQPRVGLVFELGDLVDHRKEVARVAQVVVRIDVRHAAVVAIGERRQRGHLGQEPDDLEVARVVVLDRRRLGVEGGEGADGGEQHPHGVRVVAEPLHELLDVLVDEGVDGDEVIPLVQLLLRGQLAVDEQVGDLEVAGLLGQLLDRVAAVLQDALVAIDVGNGGATRRRRHIGGVVGHQPEVVVVGLDLPQLGGPDRVVLDRDLVLLAGAVVGDGEAVARRRYPAPVRRLLSLGGHSAP
jgi:hypothetical protein